MTDAVAQGWTREEPFSHSQADPPLYLAGIDRHFNRHLAPSTRRS